MKSLSKGMVTLGAISLIVMAVVIPPLNTAFARNGSNEDEYQRRIAQGIVGVAERAGESVSEIIAQLGDQIPASALERFQEGKATLNESRAAFDGSDYRKASGLAVRALGRFKDALARMPEIKGEGESVDAIGIRQAIERAFVFIDRLGEVADKAEELGYDVSDVRSEINQGRSLLDDAIGEFDSGEVKDAARLLGEARRVIAGAMGELKSAIKPQKLKQAERFIERTIDRLEEAKRKLSGLPIPPTALENIRSAFAEAAEHLRKARGFVDTKELDEAIKSLREVGKEYEKGVERFEAEKRGIAKKLENTIDRLERAIVRLDEKLERLEAEDVDVVTSLIELLDGAKRDLERAKAFLDQGDVEAAGEEVDRAEGTISEVEEGIASLQRS